ncbi:MAG TPA: alpha/beta hydrolase [Candidatus Limnocylindria bacterium]
MSAATCIFLPGIIMPASLRYAALFSELSGSGVQTLAKELEVYTPDAPASDYTIGVEVEGLARFASEHAGQRVHLYGHSGGGAVALAFVAAYPERVLTLALDEPATDFSDEDRADPNWQEVERAQALPPDQAIPAFLRAQLAPGVIPPPQPGGPPPPWMQKRPRGIAAFASASRRHQISPERYRTYHGRVLYTYGSLSNPRWERMRRRLAGSFADFRAERFAGLHHLNTSHQAEPARVAALLRAHWSVS